MDNSEKLSLFRKGKLKSKGLTDIKTFAPSISLFDVTYSDNPFKAQGQGACTCQGCCPSGDQEAGLLDYLVVSLKVSPKSDTLDTVPRPV